MRDRETVFIFYELVMRPFDIAKDPTFSLEAFYYLLCISPHKFTLIDNEKKQANTQNVAHNMKAKVGIDWVGKPLQLLP